MKFAINNSVELNYFSCNFLVIL